MDNQVELDDVAKAQAVFHLLAPRSDTNTLTVEDYEAIDDDDVACREDTAADILKEAEEANGCESEDDIDLDNI